MDYLAVEQLAREKMDFHGLTDWTFDFDRAKGRCGQCSYSPKLITLSYHFVRLNDQPIILDTILHEIAHALVGPQIDAHGWIWRQKCILIGGDGNRLCTDAVMPAGKLIANCPSCNKVYSLHRAPKAHRYFWCKDCGEDVGRLNFRLNPALNHVIAACEPKQKFASANDLDALIADL